jgi:RNA polymerase sigma-70 factor (ECF subfamily)
MPSAALTATLEGCRHRDELSWRALYDAHFEFIYRTARRLGIPDHELEDVVHDVFVVVWRKIDTFQYGRITTWLYRICANVVSDRHRRRRVVEAFERLQPWRRETMATQERSVEQAETRQAVAAVMARMSRKKREVLALFELEGLSGAEIAERVGCPVETVWTRRHHARRDFTRLSHKMGLPADLMEETP